MLYSCLLLLLRHGSGLGRLSWARVCSWEIQEAAGSLLDQHTDFLAQSIALPDVLRLLWGSRRV